MTVARRPPTSAEVASAQRLLKLPHARHTPSTLAEVARVLDALVADRDHYRRAYEAAPSVAQAAAITSLDALRVTEGDGSALTEEQLYGAPLDVEPPAPMQVLRRDFLRR